MSTRHTSSARPLLIAIRSEISHVQDAIACHRRARAGLDGDAAAAVHDLRVAIRRLRVLLAVVGVVIEGPVIDHLMQTLRRLHRASRHTRELDVLIAAEQRRLDSLAPASPRRVALLRRLQAMRHLAEARMQHALRADRLAKLAAQLAALDATLAQTAIRDRAAVVAIAGGLSRTLGRLRRVMEPALRGEASDGALHVMRLTAKKARYRLQLLRTVAPAAGGRRLLRDLGELQDRLGAHQDAVAAARRVARWTVAAADADTAWLADAATLAAWMRGRDGIGAPRFGKLCRRILRRAAARERCLQRDYGLAAARAAATSATNSATNLATNLATNSAELT